jgi:hypothetical protein
MTAMSKANPGIKSWSIEDYLTEKMVFQNGFSKEETSASLGAYGTVISFTNLEKAIEESKDMFTKEEWLKAVDLWEYQSYLGPTFKLLSLWVARLVDKYFVD